jgi:hypothetical protein
LFTDTVNNREDGVAMKTFFERFLDEVARRLEAGEIDEEKAQRWIAEIQSHLQNYGQRHPQAPIVQMPEKQ